MSKVSTLASSEFAAVLCAMEDDDQKMRLACEWQLALDVILAEIKAHSLVQLSK